MSEAEDWQCLACVGNERKDNRCEYIRNKDFQKLENGEEEFMREVKLQQEKMVRICLSIFCTLNCIIIPFTFYTLEHIEIRDNEISCIERTF